MSNNQRKSFADKMQSAGGKMQSIGKKLTIGITIPIILFLVGLFTLPFGIIFWIVALFIFIGTFFKSKKKIS